MIGSLRGQLLSRDLRGTVLVEVAGVGYQVQATGPTSAGLGETGADVFLHVHTRVREDAITLFGFSSAAERQCFEALIGAHGVGPSVALALLSLYSPVALRHIVATDDAAALTQAPGIGKKTAVRMLVELKSRFDVELTEVPTSGLAGTTGEVGDASSAARSDVSAALAGLGYDGDEIRRVLGGLPNDGAAEDLLRQALRELARGGRISAEAAS